MKILSESIVIVVSVLFALFVNEWRTNYNDGVRRTQILENIKLEIEENKATTAELLTYYEKVVLKNIEKAIEDDALESTFMSNGMFTIGRVAPNGLIQKTYKTISWELAKQESVFSKVDFKTTKAIFEAYEMQEVGKSTLNSVIELLGDRSSNDEERLKETVYMLRGVLTELYGQGQYLMTEYEYALKELNKK